MNAPNSRAMLLARALTGDARRSLFGPAGDPVPLPSAGVLAIIAEERSIFLADAPSAVDILAALRAAALGVGAWIGPAPRITRTAVIGERFATRVTWLYGFPAGGPWDGAAPVAIDVAVTLRERVQRVLDDLTMGWQSVVVAPYAEAVYGPLAWWASGDASNTQTARELPTGFGRVDATENPVGPTTPATHPTSPAEAAAAAARAAKPLVDDVLPYVLGAGAVAALLVFLWEIDSKAIVGRALERRKANRHHRRARR